MAEDLEGSIATAWDEFESRLQTRLEAMSDDELLLVEVPQDDDEDGAAPYVQFCTWGFDQIRCEAVSNHYLQQAWRLSDEAHDELVGMGFSAPTYAPDEEADSGSANYFADLDRDDAESLALMTVQALRDVYGVPHPSLLDAEGVVEPAPDEPEPPLFQVDDGDDEGDAEVYEARVPAGPDELQAMVDATLERMLGHTPHKDDDGDIPISTDESVVWVAVRHSRPAVDVFALVLPDVTDHDLALHEVAVLNRDHTELKFVLTHGCISVRARVNAMPFVPAHLQHVVELMCSAVDQAHQDLAPRFRAVSDPDEDDD